MDVLLVGAGAREHALAWALRRSPSCGSIHAAPGNPGIARIADCHPVAAEDAEGILALARSLGVGLVVVGPEAPLAAGLADALRRGGVPVFGPSAAAARIESSKGFAKDVMEAAGVPTARRLAVPAPPCVVKADGLAAGKGVAVCRTADDLAEGLRTVAAFGGEILVEELLEGPEVSLLAVCDGRDALALPLAQDFKRAYDGDEGPNTGGMGSYAPVAGQGSSDADTLLDLAVRPVLAELARRGTPFVGVLFAGLMLTPSGPRVLEYNCRFGDPETQSVLPLLEGDLLVTLAAAAGGKLEPTAVRVAPGAAVTVVIAAGGYPERSDHGTPIEGVAEAEATGALVFHAGTAMNGRALITNGGRLLAVTATGIDVASAREAAYRAADLVRIDGARRREDIATDAVGRG